MVTGYGTAFSQNGVQYKTWTDVGIAFELPMATWLLSKLGIITPTFLKTYRKYAYVALLVVAAVITPSPDWGSQLIVVVPLVLLYEISILIAARVKKKQDAEWE